MADNNLNQKLETLKTSLKSMQRAAVAFSSGVDSTFLLKIAHDVLGKNLIAVTVCSDLFPKRELEESKEFCSANNIRQIFCNIDELQIPGFAENPENRCYICKRALFQKIIEIAKENEITEVCEGSNMDDTKDYRPGMAAVAELGIRSPLKEAGFYKSEIRQLSKELNLVTWNKPSFACLASRFEYKERITKEKLLMVEKAEQLLLEFGFSQMRVRIHKNIARIEVLPEEFNLLLQHREAINEKFAEYGFSYVTMDLKGYRTGSMNETLAKISK